MGEKNITNFFWHKIGEKKNPDLEMSWKINETTFNPNSWCIISLEMNPKILWRWTMTKCVYCCLLVFQEFEITPHFWTHVTPKKTLASPWFTWWD
jgi:hypothetical protein